MTLSNGTPRNSIWWTPHFWLRAMWRNKIDFVFEAYRYTWQLPWSHWCSSCFNAGSCKPAEWLLLDYPGPVWAFYNDRVFLVLGFWLGHTSLQLPHRTPVCDCFNCILFCLVFFTVESFRSMTVKLSRVNQGSHCLCVHQHPLQWMGVTAAPTVWLLLFRVFGPKDRVFSDLSYTKLSRYALEEWGWKPLLNLRDCPSKAKILSTQAPK